MSVLSAPPDKDLAVQLLKDIPGELRTLDQWVVWRYEANADGKRTKIPYQPWLKVQSKARINDPSTWGSFGATATVFEFGDYDGLMFAITREDPYGFVDLDHARDPNTGMIELWARDVIERLRSYTEISPSGTGIHILVRGSLPPGRRRKDGIEMYDCRRFATMTGRRLEVLP